MIPWAYLLLKNEIVFATSWSITSDADDTTLMTESEEELKSLLMKVKGESEKFALKLNIQKTKIMVHHFMANRLGNSGNSDRL